MIFLDANYLLRTLIDPASPEIERMRQIAADLFRRANRGEVELTTSDAVIAEVAFVMTSPRVYGLDVAEAAARLSTVLNLRGVKLHEKRTVLAALDLWATTPKLGFVDALTAAYAQRHGIELATFDTDFDPIPGITRYQPPDVAESPNTDR